MITATSDPTQKKIMYIMPVIFTFMFWSFPSGLVLYWLTNSLISMIEQYFIMKKDATIVKHI
jgi:YidC/Oxa1 family membrane protein insertase